MGSISSLVAATVMVRLYMVLWGKARDPGDAKHKQVEALPRISGCNDVPVGSDDRHHLVLADESSKRMKTMGP